MDLNKNNFSRLYPEIALQIKECDLVAFDLEYSGIKLTDQNNYSLFDSIEHRYQHIKSCAQSFTTFQLGIVLFTRRVNENAVILNNCSKFSSVTYNINLFPTGSDLFDSTFTCSASAMKFLRNHKMNFNDIIDNGVGFLNKEEFLQLKNKLDSYANVQNILTEEQEKVLEVQRKNVAQWLSRINTSEVADKTHQMYVACLDGLSPYFQQMYLRSHFTEISTTSTNDNKILIQQITTDQRNELDQKEIDLDPSSEKYKFCMEMLGVSKIWKLVSRLKKPIVGHNCLFDLVTIYQKFFAPLPDTFEEFKIELKKCLPTIYDTKFIFGRMRMNFKELAEVNGGLGSVFNSLCEVNSSHKELAVQIVEKQLETSGVDENRESVVRSCQAHEAGYDSFMTGSCLIYLSHILYKNQFLDNKELNRGDEKSQAQHDSYLENRSSKKIVNISVASFETYEALLKPWRNYVNVIRCHEFCVCFDQLASDDGYRTASGNQLMNTRPPFLIVYDRNPSTELVPSNDDVVNEDVPITLDEEEGSSNYDSLGESTFSQAFLEHLLFEFGDGNVKKFGPVMDDEKYQKFIVALPSYNIMRAFTKSVRKRWPRLVIREYSRLKDDQLSRGFLLGLTGVSTVISGVSILSLLKELKNYICST